MTAYCTFDLPSLDANAIGRAVLYSPADRIHATLARYTESGGLFQVRVEAIMGAATWDCAAVYVDVPGGDRAVREIAVAVCHNWGGSTWHWVNPQPGQTDDLCHQLGQRTR